MHRMRKTKFAPLGVLAVLALIPMAALAEDEAPTGWQDTAELGLVVTSGNSESTSFSLKNTLSRKWDRSGFTLKLGALKVDTTETVRQEVGGLLVTSDETDTTAENYYINGRYDREISERLFWFLGAGWDRNEPAGTENRYIGEAGLGQRWFDTDDRRFTTRYAATFTKQEDIVELEDDTFLGVRLSWDYMNKLSGNTTYANLLVVDVNADETSDWRGDMINSLTVAMSERMALKLSLQWLYDNEPSLVTEDVLGAVTLPPTIIVEADDLDTIFTASLVVNF